MSFKHVTLRMTAAGRQKSTTAQAIPIPPTLKRSSTPCYKTTLRPRTIVSSVRPSKFSLLLTSLSAVISALKTERGLALPDLINGAYEYLQTIQFKPNARIYLLDFLATTESVVYLNSCMTCFANRLVDIDSLPEEMRRSS